MKCFNAHQLFLGFRVKELGPDKNANKKAVPPSGGDEDDLSNQISPLMEGKNINQQDLALLCTHTVSIYLLLTECEVRTISY